MNLRKAVCSGLAAVMLISGTGVMSLSADSSSRLGVIKYDGGEDWDWDWDPSYYESNHQVKEFIRRLYSLALQREADDNGLDSWTSVLVENRGTGISVAYGFIYSGEFQSRNISNEEYVDLMYQMFFGRQADAAGKQGWVNVLDSMGREEGRLDVFNGFANSNEFFELCNSYGIQAGTFIPGENVDRVAKINLFVNRFYDTVLHRNGDKAGLANWTEALASGRCSGADVGYGFFFSQEYLQISGDMSYIYDLYRAFMGRSGDEAGVNSWYNVMVNGQSREHVFNGFTQSQEFANICSEYGIERGGMIDEPAPREVSIATDKLNIWSYNTELQTMIDNSHTQVPVNYRVLSSDTSAYRAALDAVLASGDQVPDIIVLDSSFSSRYLMSNNTMALSDLGISESELSDMYTYTLDLADYDGAVHGLSYSINPSVVFYNRTVASQTLGVSDPESVAPYFSTWDAFLNTARTVSTRSDGQMRVIAGIRDIYHPYIDSRTHSWSAIGSGTEDQACVGIYDLSRILIDENLTFDYGQWMEGWYNGMSDNTVLSYFGPDWLARYCMSIDPQANPDNPTAGNWGVVKAPTNTYWGGTFVAATRSCRNTSMAAQLMRDVIMDPSIASGTGAVPNSRSTLNAWANDPSRNEAMFGGQNPWGIYSEVADNIDCSPVGNNDDMISIYFQDSLDLYAHREFDSRDVAYEVFLCNIADQGLV
ncbi:MAG: extracellular solute-binding protein [Clostridiales bacterium]|nr:extracellular solute-binding protein [Clostridiales bacterium]